MLCRNTVDNSFLIGLVPVLWKNQRQVSTRLSLFELQLFVQRFIHLSIPLFSERAEQLRQRLPGAAQIQVKSSCRIHLWRNLRLCSLCVRVSLILQLSVCRSWTGFSTTFSLNISTSAPSSSGSGLTRAEARGGFLPFLKTANAKKLFGFFLVKTLLFV